MELTNSLLVAAFKITSLLAGVLFCYLGYKLFVAGIWGNAGNLEVNWNDNKVLLKKAAPGTFFALFGTAVVIVSIINGFSITTSQGGYVKATPVESQRGAEPSEITPMNDTVYFYDYAAAEEVDPESNE